MRKKRRGKRLLPTIVTFLIVLGAIIASIMVFLKVAEIKVINSTKYAAADIIATSGIKIGDNMFSVNKFEVAEKILNEYPYIESIKIRRKLPDTFTFEITERTPAVYIRADGKKWLMDDSAYVLEMFSENDKMTVPEIAGATAVVPQEGKELVLTQPEQLEALKKILVALEQTKVAGKIRQINIEKFYDIKVVYEDRFMVTLGDSENLRWKMEMMKAVASDLSEDERGTLNLSDGKRAIFLSDMGIVLPGGEDVYQESESEVSDNNVLEETTDTSENEADTGEVTETSGEEAESDISEQEETTTESAKPAETPTTPAEPEKPAETPAAPAEPEKPAETPATPAEPAKPAETPAAPAEPAKPAETPAAPAEPEKPAETPATPAEPEKPAETPVAPAEPEKPEETTATPTETEKPAETPETASESATQIE